MTTTNHASTEEFEDRLRRELHAAAERFDSDSAVADAATIPASVPPARRPIRPLLVAASLAAVAAITAVIAMAGQVGEDRPDVIAADDPEIVDRAADVTFHTDLPLAVQDLESPALTSTIDGRVFVWGSPRDSSEVGGGGQGTDSDAPDEATGVIGGDGDWTSVPAGPLGPRFGAVAAPLDDGRIVVAGGSTPSGELVDTAAIYDPSSLTWTSTAALPRARTDAFALPVAGRVVVAGGDTTQGASRELDIFDPRTGSWSSVTIPHAVRTGAASGDTVLVAGLRERFAAASRIDATDGTVIDTTELPVEPAATWSLAVGFAGGTPVVVVGAGDASFTGTLDENGWTEVERGPALDGVRIEATRAPQLRSFAGNWQVVTAGGIFDVSNPGNDGRMPLPCSDVEADGPKTAAPVVDATGAAGATVIWSPQSCTADGITDEDPVLVATIR